MRPFAPPLLLLVGLPRTAPFHFADPRTKLVHAVDDALPKSLLADISREAIASHEWESRSRPPELRDSKASTNWMPIEQFSKPRSYAEVRPPPCRTAHASAAAITPTTTQPAWVAPPPHPLPRPDPGARSSPSRTCTSSPSPTTRRGPAAGRRARSARTWRARSGGCSCATRRRTSGSITYVPRHAFYE